MGCWVLNRAEDTLIFAVAFRLVRLDEILVLEGKDITGQWFPLLTSENEVEVEQQISNYAQVLGALR